MQLKRLGGRLPQNLPAAESTALVEQLAVEDDSWVREELGLAFARFRERSLSSGRSGADRSAQAVFQFFFALSGSARRRSLPRVSTYRAESRVPPVRVLALSTTAATSYQGPRTPCTPPPFAA
jgi:hypothetical protein